ncbi:hypothetical protein [Phenylobacterium sp.]|uniref:hypothetical protein n=1 Tax=Phenylobacterium sp. TaxID=1871053 RepID=UPI002EDA31B4
MVHAAAATALIAITLVGGLIGIKAGRGVRRIVAGDRRPAMPTSTAADRPEPALAESASFDPWDAFGVAREGLALWCAACSAWGDYLTVLSRATGPTALVDAQTRLFADSLDLCSQATANRLKDAGVTAPLLNDA